MSVDRSLFARPDVAVVGQGEGGRSSGFRLGLVTAVVGLGAAACGGAEASNSTTSTAKPDTSVVVETTDPGTTLGEPSDTTITVTVPTTEVPTTEVPTTVEATTTTIDYSGIVPDLKPTVDIGTIEGMVVAVQALYAGYPYTFDGTILTVDFTATPVPGDLSIADQILGGLVYADFEEEGGGSFKERKISAIAGDVAGTQTTFFYPVVGIPESERIVGPIPSSAANLEPPANARESDVNRFKYLNDLKAVFGDKLQFFTLGVQTADLTDPDWFILDFSEDGVTKVSPTDVVSLVVTVLQQDDGTYRYIGYNSDAVEAVWDPAFGGDGQKHWFYSLQSRITGAKFGPDGRPLAPTNA